MSLSEADCKGTSTLIQGGGLSALIKLGKSCFWWLCFEDDYYDLLLIKEKEGRWD